MSLQCADELTDGNYADRSRSGSSWHVTFTAELTSFSQADCNLNNNLNNLQALLTNIAGAESQMTGHSQTHDAARPAGCKELTSGSLAEVIVEFEVAVYPLPETNSIMLFVPHQAQHVAFEMC